MRTAQQAEIAAAHQYDAGAHETDGAVAQIVGLPARACRYAFAPEQSLRNRAIGFAGEIRVKGSPREGKPAMPLLRQPAGGTTGLLSVEESPEAQRRAGAG